MVTDIPQAVSTTYDYVLNKNLGVLKRALRVAADYDAGARESYVNFRAAQEKQVTALVAKIAELDHSTLGEDLSLFLRQVSDEKYPAAAKPDDYQGHTDKLRNRLADETQHNEEFYTAAEALGDTLQVLVSAEGFMKTSPATQLPATQATKDVLDTQKRNLNAQLPLFLRNNVTLAGIENAGQSLQDAWDRASRIKASTSYLEHGAGVAVAAPQVAKFSRPHGMHRP